MELAWLPVSELAWLLALERVWLLALQLALAERVAVVRPELVAQDAPASEQASYLASA